MASVYFKNGSFHLRAYSSVNLATGQPNTKRGLDGNPLRIQQTVLLHRKDEVHTSERSTAILLLAQAKEKEIAKWEKLTAAGEKVRPTKDMTVGDFWETTFLPYITREKSHATIVSYKGFWGTYLSKHFNGTKTLGMYESHVATDYLEELAEKYSTNTVTHIRALGSAIFAYAISKGLIQSNPWAFARKNIKCVKTEETYAYSEEEIEDILEALSKIEDEYYAKAATMLVSSCFYAGLRPSEAVALRWENIDISEGTIHVCEAFVNGRFKDETKTGEERTITMLPELLLRFKQWASTWHNPADGLVFPNQSGDNPIDLHNMIARFIKPTLKTAKLDWYGFYACRRGYGTELFGHGATVEEIAANMGNSIEVAYRNYVKDKSKTAARGVAKWAKAKKARHAAAGRK